MYWVLQDISDIQYCEVCKKKIIKYVWSTRRGNEICCSSICVDNYSGHDLYICKKS